MSPFILGGPPRGPMPPNLGWPLHLRVVRTKRLGMLMMMTTSSRLIRVTSTKLTANISSPISKHPELKKTFSVSSLRPISVRNPYNFQKYLKQVFVLLQMVNLQQPNYLYEQDDKLNLTTDKRTERCLTG